MRGHHVVILLVVMVVVAIFCIADVSRAGQWVSGAGNILFESSDYELNGFVKVNNEPQPGVTVTIPDCGLSAITTSNGSYHITIPADYEGWNLYSEVYGTYHNYGYYGASDGFMVSAGSSGTANISVAVPPCNVQGIVYVNDLPFGGASVKVKVSGYGGVFNGTTDASGFYSIPINYYGPANVTVNGTYGGFSFGDIARFSSNPDEYPYYDFYFNTPGCMLSGIVKVNNETQTGANVYILEAPDLSATTAPDGSYSIPIPVSYAGQSLTAAAYGTYHNHDYDATTSPFTVTTGANVTRNFAVTVAPCTVNGTVYVNDHAFAGAHASIRVNGYPGYFNGTTASDGTYSIPVNYFGPANVTVSGTYEGYSLSDSTSFDAYSGGYPDNPSWFYTPGCVLSGFMNVNGEPQPGVTVGISGYPDLYATTAPNGSYFISIPGSYEGRSMIAEVSGTYHNYDYLGTSDPFLALAYGNITRNITITVQPCTVSAYVIVDGIPAAGVPVKASGNDANGLYAGSISNVTDINGRCLLVLPDDMINEIYVYAEYGRINCSHYLGQVSLNSMHDVSFNIDTSAAANASFTSDVSWGFVPLTVQFYDTSTGDLTAWSWNFSDGTPDETTQNAIHTFTTAGKYNVTLTITDSYGLSSSDTREIAVTALDGHEDIIINVNTLLNPGEYHFRNLTITDNATLTLGSDISGPGFQSVIIHADNININAGSTITADGLGYSSVTGPGAGMWSGGCSGGGYGGDGGDYGYEGGHIYGSALRPVDFGSGGYSSGGGVIRLDISDTLTVDGRISSSGYGGGSGGSIYITTGSLNGAGTIAANGGDGYGYACGGGGRIAVYYSDNAFTGSAEATRGPMYWYGSPADDGTVVFVDTLNNVLYPGSTFKFQENDGPFEYVSIIINNSRVVMEGSPVIRTDSIVMDSSVMCLSGTEYWDVNSFVISDSSTLTAFQLCKLNLNVSSLVIDTSSIISVDGMGYSSVTGPGAGEWSGGCSGGGYGGDGGDYGYDGGHAYGSALRPVDFGSGGYSSGGGAIRLNITDTLTVDGRITSSGYGGGSGGSIYITTDNMQGTGSIAANGGDGYGYACGGGGRIAVYYTDSTFTGNAVASRGPMSYYGAPGGDGTVVFVDTLNNVLYPGSTFKFQENDGPFEYDSILINNSRVAVEGSPVISTDSIVMDSSVLCLSGTEYWDVNSFVISDSSTLTAFQLCKLNLNVSSLVIDSTSAISADGMGYPSVTGPGAGEWSGGCSGGGYGGDGGDYGYEGGHAYGSALRPVDFGSGGYSSGGGAIRLNITDTLTVDGRITSNGYGGGSGGSIYITTNNMRGAGQIAANGGDGYGYACGGGGRVAVYYRDSTFSGSAYASRGPMSYYGAPGGDGTVVFVDTLNNILYPGVTFRFEENDGPFEYSTIVFNNSITTTRGAPIIMGGGIILDSSTLSISGNETIDMDSIALTDNSVITTVQEGRLYLNVPNLTIDSSSAVSADGMGYPSVTGPGAGEWSGGCSGGGYGGDGGDYGYEGGHAYGSALQPVDFGSGGYSSGGGVVRLDVTDTLTVDGRITSNGYGGGSGGSIYITTNNMRGAGSIAANGGDGYGYACGGGGRIAVYYRGSAYTGNAVASRGPMSYYGAPGGDGTVVFVDTLNNIMYPGSTFRFQENDGPFEYYMISLNNSLSTTQGTLLIRCNDLNLDSSTLSISENDTMDVDSIVLKDNSLITTVQEGRLYLNVPDIAIDPSSAISADGMGYPSVTGPGAGEWSGGCSGGGYGGDGGDYGYDGGHAYGSALRPVDFGSGGYSSGGGLIRLDVTDTLTVDGRISSNGYGGGSGGSVYITVHHLKGAGSITANGGDGYGYACGGGGRVAVYYRDSTFSGSAYASRGPMSYYGAPGGDGTVVFIDTLNNIMYPGSTFRFQENDGPFEYSAIRAYNSRMVMDGSPEVRTGSFIMDSSTLYLSGTESLRSNSLTLTDGSTITAPQLRRIYLTVPNMVVDSTSAITADSLGYSSYSGPGAGDPGYGGGAGYGGSGSYAHGTYGMPYGSALRPEDFGSGGYGNGGGLIRLDVSDSLTVDGRVTANGDMGGSGGSVFINTNNLQGSGTISANGGSYSYYWGGGGGRVAIYYRRNYFHGTSEARGGSGAKTGTVNKFHQSYAPVTTVDFAENHYSRAKMVEDVTARTGMMNGANAAGDEVNGTVSFTGLDMVSVSSGTFSGKGFARGKWTATLADSEAGGMWEGMTYLKDGKVYVKGTLSGDLSGIMDGYLTESTPGSGVYDAYYAMWQLNSVNGELKSSTMFVNGTIEYQATAEYQDVNFDLYQSAIDGTTSGNYTGPASIVLTHIGIHDSSNPYYGEGFSYITYITGLGSGNGWTYDKTNWYGSTDMHGMLSYPLYGQADGTLDDTKTPAILSLSIENVNIRSIPEPALTIKIFGPSRISSGQKFTYNLEAGNVGYVGADGVVVNNQLSPSVSLKSASPGYHYDRNSHSVSWRYDRLDPYARITDWVTVEAKWGLSQSIRDTASVSQVNGKPLTQQATLVTAVLNAHDPNVKYGPEGHIQPGQGLDYRVEFENEGEGIAFGVYFVDILDRNLNDSTLSIGPVYSVKNNTVIAPQGIYNPETRIVSWFVGEVGPGEGGYANISINAYDNATPGTRIENYGIVYFPSVPEETRTNSIVSRVGMPGAAYVNGNIPANVYAGSAYNVSVTFRNNGTYPWSEADQIRLLVSGDTSALGVPGDCDNYDGDYPEYAIPSGTVLPGETCTWNVTITPRAAGSFSLGFAVAELSGSNVTEFGGRGYVTIPVSSSGPGNKPPSPGVLYNISLAKGWNLISTPVAPEDISPDGIFAGIADKVVVVWGYDSNDASEPWRYYVPGRSDNTLAAINETMGVWVLSENDTMLAIKGQPVYKPYVPVNNDSWNLIGHPYLYTFTPDELYSSSIAVWGYEEEGWYLYTTVPGYDSTLIELRPGKGYWVLPNM